MLASQGTVGSWAGAGMGVDHDPRFAPFGCPFGEGTSNELCRRRAAGHRIGMTWDEVGLLESA